MGNLFSKVVTSVFKEENRRIKKDVKEPDKFCTPPRNQSRANSKDGQRINRPPDSNKNQSATSLLVARGTKSTPIRPPGVYSHDFKDFNVRGRNRTNSSPSRLSSFPPKRNLSQISLLGSGENRGTPIRPPSNLRIRGSTRNDVFDLGLPGTSTMNARRNDFRDIPSSRNPSSVNSFHSVTDQPRNLDFGESLNKRNDVFDLSLSNGRREDTTFQDISTLRSSSSVFSFHPGDQLQPNLVFSEPLDTRQSRLRNNPRVVPGKLTNNLLSSRLLETERRDDLSDAFYQVPIPAHKNSQSSFEFHSATENQSLNESSECYETLPRRLSCPLTNTGCSHSYRHSKIPLKTFSNLERQNTPKPADFMNFSEYYQGRHTQSSNKRNRLSGCQGKGDAADVTYTKPNDISNWSTFRNDTSMKFEKVYKSLSRRKHRPSSNIIDATTHAQWIRLAGIPFDKDSTMFKSFAGGKVVLTFGEYKFLIHKICTVYELDYWDVLRKMATFQDDDLQNGDGLAFS